MDSDRGGNVGASDPRPGAMGAVWAFLTAGDTAVGILLAMALLFVIGTILWEAAPVAYEGLGGDDIRFFFSGAWRPRDLWFWGLLAAGVLLGMSLAACAVARLRTRIRERARDLRDYGTILAHAGAGIALIAHAIGGWAGTASFAWITTARAAPIGAYGVRLIEGETLRRADGTVRSERIRFDVATADQGVVRYHASPNSPARWSGGCEEILLMQVRDEDLACVLSIEGRTDTLGPGDTRILRTGGRLAVEAVHGPPDFRIPIAQVRLIGSGVDGQYLLGQGLASDVPAVSMIGAVPRPAALISYRYAPGTIWLLIGGSVFSFGLLLAGARRLRRREERNAGR